MSKTAATGDFPYQWYCNGCCAWHRGPCCFGGARYQLTYNNPVAAAGHCGKCGAPYTIDYNHMGTDTKFNATCRCWNVG